LKGKKGREAGKGVETVEVGANKVERGEDRRERRSE